MTARRNLLKKAVVALFVVTLFYSRQIGSLTGVNRYYMHWQLADGLAMILAIILLALAAVAVSVALEVKQWSLATRVFNHAFLLILASSMIAFGAPRASSNGWPEAVLVVSIGVVGYSLSRKRSRLVRYAQNFCLLFSPYVLVAFFTILRLGSWGGGGVPRPSFEASQGRPPIFFITFDGWSRPRNVHEKGLPPSYANLAELAGKSFFFNDARSPAATTVTAIPSILYQIDPTSEPQASLWQRGNLFMPRTEAPSLFDVSRKHGYRTALVGYYFPYCKLLAEQLDYCFSAPHAPKGNSLPGKMVVSLVRALGSLPDPVSAKVENLLYGYLYSRNWFELSNRILAESLWLMEEGPSDLFAFTHFNIPHWPYVFDPDGSFNWQIGHEDRRGPRDPELYPRSLEYVDAVIGRLVAAMRSAGKLEDALVIVTADHGLNEKRVPLVVKLPHQQSAYQVRGAFGNNELGSMIEGVLKGSMDPDGWQAELAARGLEVSVKAIARSPG